MAIGERGSFIFVPQHLSQIPNSSRQILQPRFQNVLIVIVNKSFIHPLLIQSLPKLFNESGKTQTFFYFALVWGSLLLLLVFLFILWCWSKLYLSEIQTVLQNPLIGCIDQWTRMTLSFSKFRIHQFLICS